MNKNYFETKYQEFLAELANFDFSDENLQTIKAEQFEKIYGKRENDYNQLFDELVKKTRLDSISFKYLQEGRLGEYNKNLNQLNINEYCNDIQTLATAIHESCHVIIKRKNINLTDNEEDSIVEAATYILLKTVEINNKNISFYYIKKNLNSINHFFNNEKIKDIIKFLSKKLSKIIYKHIKLSKDEFNCENN